MRKFGHLSQIMFNFVIPQKKFVKVRVGCALVFVVKSEKRRRAKLFN